MLFLLSFQWIILHEPTRIAIVITIEERVGPWRPVHWIDNTCRSKNLKLSKFTYKNVSKDQMLTDFKNLSFIWKSNMTSIY